MGSMRVSNQLDPGSLNRPGLTCPPVWMTTCCMGFMRASTEMDPGCLNRPGASTGLPSPGGPRPVLWITVTAGCGGQGGERLRVRGRRLQLELPAVGRFGLELHEDGARYHPIIERKVQGGLVGTLVSHGRSVPAVDQNDLQRYNVAWVTSLQLRAQRWHPRPP